MTHKYQGKNLPTPHTPACTAAPGPCICNNNAPVVDGMLNDVLGAEPFNVDNLTVRDIDVSKLTVDVPKPRHIGRLESVTLDPNGRGIIALDRSKLADHIAITDANGGLVAAFNEEGTLTGGNIHRKLMTLESMAVTRTRTLKRLEREARKDRSTILKLFILSLGGWAFAAARGIWGF